MVKNPPVSVEDAGDMGLIPWLGRYPEEGNGNPLQYCCLENSMDEGAWWATVHGATKSDTTEQLHFSLYVISCRFAYTEESLHPSDKFHLIMVSEPFTVLLDSIC